MSVAPAFKRETAADPWLLARTGSDPAYGSGPLARIVQDVLSLLIYFGGVSAIVL